MRRPAARFLPEHAWEHLTTKDTLARVRALLVDLDGVTYRGDTALPGATELATALPELGIDYMFVTNNSSLTPEQFAEKLTRLGVDAHPDQIVTSAGATAEYASTVEAPGARVLVIGEEGLQRAMTNAGFEMVDAGAACVVVGLDRHLTYAKLARACVAIRGGARFLATNNDPAYPVESGWWPGAGAIVAALTAATGLTPTVIGKPEPTLLQVALRHLGVASSETAMVGDQILTDVRAGRAAGVTTILVGIDQPTPDVEPRPDFRVADLHELVEALRQTRDSSRS